MGTYTYRKGEGESGPILSMMLTDMLLFSVLISSHLIYSISPSSFHLLSYMQSLFFPFLSSDLAYVA